MFETVCETHGHQVWFKKSGFNAGKEASLWEVIMKVLDAGVKRGEKVDVAKI